jgi:hypothetical protein
MNPITDPEIPAELIETTAKAIYRAKLQYDDPKNAMATCTADEFDYLWPVCVFSTTRLVLLEQAVAALRASALMERVAELEETIKVTRNRLYDLESSTPELDEICIRLHLVKIKK